MRNTAYTQTGKLLHWLVAGMIICQYVLAELAAEQASPLAQLALLANHKSVGITILVLAIVRVLWRWRNPPPALPASMPKWQQRTSNVSHAALYLLLFILPISGWMLSSASAYAVSWFNLFTLPDLVDASADLKETLALMHEIFAKALFLIALLHILAALKHGFIDRDGVLSRMVSLTSLTLFALTAICLTWVLQLPAPTQVGNDAAKSVGKIATNQGPKAEAKTVLNFESSIPSWDIDYSQSQITFRAEQAGAEFDGKWTKWQAIIHFDPKQPDQSSAEVVVDIKHVDSQDSERDSTIVGSEFFDAENFPQAVFKSHQITQQQDHFVAHGQLSIKDISLPVTLQFSATEQGIKGQVTLDRLAFNIGTGDWQDTTWVGQSVLVQFQVKQSSN